MGPYDVVLDYRLLVVLAIVIGPLAGLGLRTIWDAVTKPRSRNLPPVRK